MNKKGTQVIFNLSSNVFGNSNDETYSTNNLLVTNTQVSGFVKAFVYN